MITSENVVLVAQKFFNFVTICSVPEIWHFLSLISSIKFESCNVMMSIYSIIIVIIIIIFIIYSTSTRGTAYIEYIFWIVNHLVMKLGCYRFIDIVMDIIFEKCLEWTGARSWIQAKYRPFLIYQHTEI